MVHFHMKHPIAKFKILSQPVLCANWFPGDLVPKHMHVAVVIIFT